MRAAALGCRAWGWYSWPPSRSAMIWVGFRGGGLSEGFSEHSYHLSMEGAADSAEIAIA
jgi:hypothetical protein